jgi:hypothetical protein
MAVFAVTDNDNLVEAVNYALANLGQGGTGGTPDGNTLVANTTTGIISRSGSTTVIGYLYQYINVAYADSSDGSTNFSRSRFNNALYYGLLNNNLANPGTTELNNPANYVWYAVTGGFSTNKFLYYTTYGGRQVQFTVATAAPNVFFAQAVDLTAIDLDFVLSTQALPTVIVTAYLRATSVPATPTGGTYDFNTLVFTPPVGWNASVPAGTDPFYTSQNTFTAPVTGTVATPDLAWTAPVLTGENGTDGTSVFVYTVFQQSATAPATPGAQGSYNFGTTTGTPPAGWSNTPVSVNTNPIWATTAQATTTVTGGTWTAVAGDWSTPVQYTGAGGVDGERGFIPMGYVLTTQNPTIAPGNTQANLTAAFASARTNPSAPIGTGYAPISGDTASFTWGSNTAVNTVYTYSSGNVWQLASGQIINGNVFVTGSVNASALNANDVYALNLRGGNVTVGTYSGTGYWFQASSGNAYVAGNLVIGNNANIGNNLTIGNSVTIGGVALNGNLVANIVGSSQLISNSVVAGKVANNAITVGTIAAGAVTTNTMTANTINGNIITFGTLNGDKITANTISGNTIIANTIAGNTIIANSFLANTINGNAITVNSLNANSIVANSITATQISSAYIYAGNIVSFGANVGNTSSSGYWLAFNTGDARFGGNVSIGANLNVQGLITTGGLNANTVVTTTIQPQTISGGSAGISGPATSPFVITGPLTANTVYITDQFVSINTTQANQAVYAWGGCQRFDIVATMSGVSQIQVNLALVQQAPGGGLTVLAEYSSLMTNTSGVSGTYSQIFENANFPGYTDIAPTAAAGYIYGLVFLYGLVAGTVTPQSVTFYDRNALAQTLKR